MIQVLEIKNCKWADAEHTKIDCDAKFSHYPNQFMPFTAVETGDETHSHEVFANAIAGRYGVISEYSPPPAPTTEALIFTARSIRDRLLAESDWTQNGDVPQTTKDLWMAYRQALRDIPQQTGFPENIQWPVKPV